MTGQERRLRVGDIVIENEAARARPNRGLSRPLARGIVVWSRGYGMPQRWVMPPAANEAVIRLGAGHHLHTTYHDEFDLIPETQHTGYERMYRAWLIWERPTWVPDGEEPQDPDSMEFAILRALLLPSEREQVFPDDGDWPTSVWELSLRLAALLDDRIRDARLQATALTRLER